MRRKIIPYNAKLKEYARYLRRNMTEAEVILWKELKGRGVCGLDFDRQRPIDRYIVDFFCKDLQLAIEVDGSSHDSKKHRDKVRQERLELLGVRFLRFWDYDVKHNCRGVIQKIEEWVQANGETHP